MCPALVGNETRSSAFEQVTRRPFAVHNGLRALGVATTGVVSAGKVVVSERIPNWQGVDIARGAFGAGRAYPVLGGKLHAGYNGGAGEIGVLRDIGWYTAFDRFLSYGQGEPGTIGDAAERVFDAVRRGEKKATKIVADFVADLVTGVAATALTVDPQLVVITFRASHGT